MSVDPVNHRAWLGGSHVKVECRAALVRPVDPEDLADHPELERRHAGERHADDFLKHLNSFGRKRPIDGNTATPGRKSQCVDFLP